MRTVGKIILFLLLLVVVVAGAGLAYLFFAFPNVPVAAEYKIEPTLERLKPVVNRVNRFPDAQ